MILPLAEFDKSSYDKKLDGSVTFGYFTGDCGELKKDVLRVADDWGEYFTADERIYCAFIDGKVASFCLSTAWESTR